MVSLLKYLGNIPKHYKLIVITKL